MGGLWFPLQIRRPDCWSLFDIDIIINMNIYVRIELEIGCEVS